MKKVLSLICLSLSLVGCSIFSPYGTDNTPDPAPLQKYTPTVNPKIFWQTDAGLASEGDYLRLTPAVANTVVYTIDQQGRFYATSARNGKRLWSKDFVKGGKSGVATDGNIIAFANDHGVLHVIDATQQGHELWQTTLSDQALAAPTILPNMVLVKTIDGNVTAFSRENGQQIWQYQHPVPGLMLRASSTLLVNGQTIYTGFTDGKVVAISLATGDELWSQQVAEPKGFAEIERMVDIDANLILRGSRLFVATYQGQVAALNVATGNILWKEPNSVYADITADDEALYAVHADGTITAYDQISGKVLWEQKALAWRFLSGPTVFKNDLVVGDLQGYLHFINSADGSLVGRIQMDKTPATIINAPQVVGQSLIVIDTQGHLAAVGS